MPTWLSLWNVCSVNGSGNVYEFLKKEKSEQNEKWWLAQGFLLTSELLGFISLAARCQMLEKAVKNCKESE